MAEFDSHAALALLDPIDPQSCDCAACGAVAGHPCDDRCPAWPALVAMVATSDEVGVDAAGRLAVIIASDLRAAGAPGLPVATRTERGGVAVVLRYPSGRDWIVASISPGARPVVCVARWDDAPNAAAAPARHVEIHDRVSAERAIIALAASTIQAAQ